jgi:hypothetical protein
MGMSMRTQVSDRPRHWHNFLIDPIATMVMRLGQMRLALDPKTVLKIGQKQVIQTVHSQLRSLKRLMNAYSDAPLLALIFEILDRIDQALENAALEFVHKTIAHLEDSLSGAC